jgi:outer membrane protein
MIMKRLTLLISLLVALSTQARDLRLAQALQLAEQHSFALQKARSNSAAALTDLSGARADRLPTLSLTGTAFYVSEIPTMTISAGPVSVTRDVGTDQTYQTDLRLSVPLFTGGRISGNIDIASATAAYYAASEIADCDRTAMQTRLEYFNLERADRQLAAARAALERTHSIDRDVHSLYQAGMADSVNILDASLAVTRATFGVPRPRPIAAPSKSGSHISWDSRFPNRLL